jgi:hypothetical protein
VASVTEVEDAVEVLATGGARVAGRGCVGERVGE